ncbi:hypothetical protein MTO96_016215 [Rhipicephalus appendiculatus]
MVPVRPICECFDYVYDLRISGRMLCGESFTSQRCRACCRGRCECERRLTGADGGHALPQVPWQFLLVNSSSAAFDKA